MKRYHGSYLAVEKLDISFSRANVDFGCGFYTTPIKEQAISWAQRFKHKRGQGVISIYEIEESKLKEEASILAFDGYSIDWLDFITFTKKNHLEDFAMKNQICNTAFVISKLLISI